MTKSAEEIEFYLDCMSDINELKDRRIEKLQNQVL